MHDKVYHSCKCGCANTSTHYQYVLSEAYRCTTPRLLLPAFLHDFYDSTFQW